MVLIAFTALNQRQGTPQERYPQYFRVQNVDAGAQKPTPERYAWPISEDESARLTGLLGYDFDALDMGGTYVGSPPLKCARCGKDTEFIDWCVLLFSSFPLKFSFSPHILFPGMSY